MNRILSFVFTGMIFMIVGGCGLFDSGEVWRGDPYILSWIDIPENVTLSYNLGNGSSVGRIEEQVFAVGWNDRYLVAQQHPKGDKKIINYFIIDAKKDSPMAEPKDVVIGPLTEEEYKVKVGELNLPQFTKILSSLK
jgi:hypothetical protein